MIPAPSPDRTAVIAGATGGIGTASARELRARGFSLVLHGRRETTLRDLAAELEADAVLGDAGDAAVVSDLVGRAPGGIDLLVHAAGTLRHRAVREQPVAEFDEIVEVNLRSAYLLVQAALPRLNVGARIILVSSLAATLEMRGLAAYSASKAGLNAMAKSLAAEVERDGINVTLVTPGAVDTPMMDNAAASYPALPASDVGAVVGWLADLPPRMVVPELLFRAPFRGPFSGPPTGGAAHRQQPATD